MCDTTVATVNIVGIGTVVGVATIIAAPGIAIGTITYIISSSSHTTAIIIAAFTQEFNRK